MVRLEGPGVLALNALFRWDWEVQTDRDLSPLAEREDPAANLRAGTANVQVIPSGPGGTGASIYQLLLLSIYSAQRELAMTTPYFVPDEAITTALLTAANRGVKVTVIMPERNDSRLVHYTVNLDVRSFWLDFEVTLCVYDPDFSERLLALQDKYIKDSIPVDPQTWNQRPGKERFIENLARLASPLL
jgi:cardiolipin synthase